MIVHNISAIFQVFHFLSPHHFFPMPLLWFAGVDLSIVMALPCVSLLAPKVSLVSVSFFVVFCAVRWRESSVSQGLSPVYVPDTVCAFRSSCHPVDRGEILCFLQRPISQPSEQLHSYLHPKMESAPAESDQLLGNSQCPSIACEELVFTVFFLFCRLDIFAWKTSSSQSPIGWALFHHRCCASRRVPRSESSSAKELPTSPVCPRTQRL